MYNTLRTKFVLPGNDVMGVGMRTPGPLRQDFTKLHLVHRYNFSGSGNDTGPGTTAGASVFNPSYVAAENGYFKQMIDCNGTSTYATASHSYSGDFSIIHVINFDAFKSGESQIYRITGAGSTNIGYSHTGTGGTNTFQLFSNDGTSGSSIVLSGFTPVVNRTYVLLSRCDGTNRFFKAFDTVTGITHSGSTTTASSITMSGTGQFFRHPTVGGRYMDGQCSDLIIYPDYAITDAEFDKICKDAITNLH